MVEIEWIRIEAGSAWLGDDRGALVHASGHPRHEIRIDTAYEISNTPITFAQWAELSGKAAAGEISNEPVNRLTPLMVEAGLTHHADLRPPSEAEWALAASQGAISRGEAEVELLSDRPPRSGYWGAPCDGSPWLPALRAGGVSDHTAHVTCVWRGSGTVRGATPRGVSRPQMGFRLVRASPRSEGARLPVGPGVSGLLIREAVIAMMIGILPAFAYAWFNASERYLSESWLNIAMGGIFFSLMTAIIWRPKVPIYAHQDGRMRRVK